MAGGIVSKLVGFQTFVQIGEGTTAPVFPVLHPNQMQIENVKAVEGRDAQGNIVDYHSDLVVYKDGKVICRGTATVNNPLSCNGYRLHQASFSDDGAALRVRDVKTGAVVYDEVQPLSRQPAAPSPRFTVKDANGGVLFDDYLVLRPIDDNTSLAFVPVDRIQKLLPVVLYHDPTTDGWRLSVVHVRDANDPTDTDIKFTIDQGGSTEIGGLDFSFSDLRGLPVSIVQGIPGMDPVGYLQLVTEQDGSTMLDIQNPAHPESPAARLPLRVNEPVVAGDYEYTFEGPRTFTGILVKRDPGSWFIWVATALLLAGLAVTFWVPRRRLWAKITPERTYLAGIAERNAHLGAELERLLAEAKT
jgi:hypothetical protein